MLIRNGLIICLAYLIWWPSVAYCQSASLTKAYEQSLKHYSAGRYQHATPFAEKALTLGESEFGPDHLFTAEQLNNLATIYQAQDRYELAQPLYQRALDIREKALGPEHPVVA